MATYAERYQQGDYEAVWAELVAQGAVVRSEPLFSDAKAVADLMMRRARHNVALLVERLHGLNFEFTTEPVWAPPDPHLLARLDTIEQQYGPLPMVFRSWFEVVGQISFIGVHPRLSRYLGQKPPGEQGPVSDPLVIQAYGVQEDEEEVLQPPYIFEFAPDINHKANYSGGGASWVELPAPGFDAPLGSTSSWHGLYFVPYLRLCFDWGGFPRLAHKPDAAAAAREELALLTKDLLLI
jgi:hypothetical protein